MNRFTVTDTPLAGLKIVQRQQVGDSRGFLSRLFCAAELATVGWNRPIAQINQTHTQRQGTVRGMHYQKPPFGQAKLVSCVNGRVLDVIADLRPESPTYLRWAATELSVESGRSVYIPPGYAHGFVTLEDDSTLVYLLEGDYQPEAAGTVRWNDAALGIRWPVESPILAERDRLAADFVP
jgi:dTDP-4-dehydrorhamnose 3,5-epimerase